MTGVGVFPEVSTRSRLATTVLSVGRVLRHSARGRTQNGPAPVRCRARYRSGSAAAERAAREEVAGESPRVVPATGEVAVIPPAGVVIPVVEEAGAVAIPIVVRVPHLGHAGFGGGRVRRGGNRQRGQRNCGEGTGDGHSGHHGPAWDGRRSGKHRESFLSAANGAFAIPRRGSARICASTARPPCAAFVRKARGGVGFEGRISLWYDDSPSRRSFGLRVCPAPLTPPPPTDRPRPHAVD